MILLVQEDMDPFEMLEPVNILDRLAKDFFDKIVSDVDLSTEWTQLICSGIETMERSKRSVGRSTDTFDTKSEINSRRRLFRTCQGTIESMFDMTMLDSCLQLVSSMCTSDYIQG
jgi:hypothetical protein